MFNIIAKIYVGRGQVILNILFNFLNWIILKMLKLFKW